MSNVQQTSMEAFWSIEPDLGKRQKDVLEALRELGEANNREISVRARMPINTVTPRIKELRELGLVECVGTGIDEVTHRRTMHWKVVR